MMYRARWLRRSVPLDRISEVRRHGAALIVAGLVLPIAAAAEAADSTSPGTFPGPALTAGSAIAGPVDVDLDGSGSGVAGRYPQGWLHVAEAISLSPTDTEPGTKNPNPCQVTDGDGFSTWFNLFSEALDKFGSLY